MARFRMENFGGEIPAIDNRLMPDNQAAVSVNTWLLSGRVEPLPALVPIHTCVNPAARSVFRLPIATPSVDNMVNSYWLEFENQNVRVIASPVSAQAEGGRYYWADGIYPKYMTGDMIKNANATPPVAPYRALQAGSAGTGNCAACCACWRCQLNQPDARLRLHLGDGPGRGGPAVAADAQHRQARCDVEHHGVRPAAGRH